jgi:hypothetical protein
MVRGASKWRNRVRHGLLDEFVDFRPRVVKTVPVAIHPEPDPTLSQLRALERAAELTPGSADTLERQRIWQSVYRLEEYTQRVGGTRLELVQRHSGGLTLSGERLLAEAIKVAAAVDRFNIAIRSDPVAPPHVRVACYPAQASLVAWAARRLESVNSEVSVDLAAIDDTFRRDSGGSLLSRLERGEIDVVIAPRSVGRASVRQRPLYTWNLLAVGSVEWCAPFGGSFIDMNQLLEQRHLMTSPVGHQTSVLMESNGMDRTPWFTSASVDALCSLAESGWGVAVVAGDSVPVRRTDAEVCRNWPLVAADGSVLSGTCMAIIRQDESRPIVLQLVEELGSSVVEEPSFGNRRVIAPLAQSL